jgi:hypothetical protein
MSTINAIMTHRRTTEGGVINNRGTRSANFGPGNDGRSNVEVDHPAERVGAEY